MKKIMQVVMKIFGSSLLPCADRAQRKKEEVAWAVAYVKYSSGVPFGGRISLEGENIFLLVPRRHERRCLGAVADLAARARRAVEQGRMIAP